MIRYLDLKWEKIAPSRSYWNRGAEWWWGSGCSSFGNTILLEHNPIMFSPVALCPVSSPPVCLACHLSCPDGQLSVNSMSAAELMNASRENPHSCPDSPHFCIINQNLKQSLQDRWSVLTASWVFALHAPVGSLHAGLPFVTLPQQFSTLLDNSS